MKLISGQAEGSDRERLLEDQDQELSVLTRKLEMRERELAIQQEALDDESEEQERQQTRLAETGKASSVWPFPYYLVTYTILCSRGPQRARGMARARGQ